VKRSQIRLVGCLSVVAAWLLTAGAVAGHGGTPEIELDPDTVAAGRMVEVAGENFEDIESIGLFLVGSGSRVSLGSVAVGGDGHLKVEVGIPAETAAGPYVIEADSPDGPLASAPLTITATASPSPEPLPSASPSDVASPAPTASASPDPVPSPAPSASPSEEPTGGRDGGTILAVIAIAVVAGVAGGIVLARRGRPSA